MLMTDCPAVDLTELAQVPALGRLSNELLGASTLFERYSIRVRSSHSEHTLKCEVCGIERKSWMRMVFIYIVVVFFTSTEF